MKRFIKQCIQNLCAFLLFLFLVSILLNRLNNFIKTHQDEALHELDTELLAQITNVQNQLEINKNKFQDSLTHKEKEILNVLEEKTKKLENDYKKNPHGLFILGPIGTIALVMKEQRIKQQLLEIIVTLFDIIRKYAPLLLDLKKEPIKTVEEGIGLIQKITQ